MRKHRFWPSPANFNPEPEEHGHAVWPKERPVNEGTTHSDRCWRWHLVCAVRRCEELEREIQDALRERDEARRLAEEWRSRTMAWSCRTNRRPSPRLPWHAQPANEDEARQHLEQALAIIDDVLEAAATKHVRAALRALGGEAGENDTKPGDAD